MSEIVKIKDLPFGVSGIYKINYLLGKYVIITIIKRFLWIKKRLGKRLKVFVID